MYCSLLVYFLFFNWKHLKDALNCISLYTTEHRYKWLKHNWSWSRHYVNLPNLKIIWSIYFFCVSLFFDSSFRYDICCPLHGPLSCYTNPPNSFLYIVIKRSIACILTSTIDFGTKEHPFNKDNSYPNHLFWVKLLIGKPKALLDIMYNKSLGSMSLSFSFLT